MYEYFAFLYIFLMLFALLYVLAYLPGVLIIKTWSKQNLIFLLALGLTYLFIPNKSTIIKLSSICSILFILLIFNIYLLFNNKLKATRRILNVIDFIVCSLTIFASACIIAYIDDLPIKDKILERHKDGSYFFKPGYLFKMINDSLSSSFLIISIKYAHLYLMKKWEERQKRKIDKLKLQKKNIETQFGALQAKVNPHFLYNSLNSIAGLATIDGEKTRKMALALAQFFRYSMTKEQEMMITVDREAEMTNTYLEIEKIRFGDKLNYHIEISNEAKLCKVPRMLIQPLVENCIKHGMKGSHEALKVEVSFSVSDNTLTISVRDNGTHFPKDIIPGYGIQSVYDKLDLLFPEKYHVELKTTPEKDFKIYIRMNETQRD